MSLKEVVIASATRTPIGCFQGALASFSASDLGALVVREAVRRTGMGEIVPPRDAPALAAALVRVLQHREEYRRPRAQVAQVFDMEASLRQYEDLFAQLASRH